MSVLLTYLFTGTWSCGGIDLGFKILILFILDLD